MNAVVCWLRGHLWREEPWPRELGPYDQTMRFLAVQGFGAECFEVCTRCGAGRWRSYVGGGA